MTTSTTPGASTNGSTGGGGPAQPETIDQINATIAERDRELKQLQQVLADLNALKTAKTAFDQEQETSGKALATSLGNVEAALQKAAELTGQADKTAANVSDEQVRGIKDAVDRIDEQTAKLRGNLHDSVKAVVDKTAQETTAKAEAANARARTAEAKRRLAERTQAIDLEITRIGALVTEARTANTQKQYTTAYLLITELRSAVDRLEKLTDAVELAGLQQAVAMAWEAEREAGAKERTATWDLSKAKEAQQAAQTALTKFESSRRTELNNAVQSFGSGGGVSARATPPQPTEQPGAQASPPNEIVASPQDYYDQEIEGPEERM